MAEQTVWKEEESKEDSRRIGLFMQYGFTSPKVSPVGQAIAVGMEWIGPIAARENDVFGFGAAMERFSLKKGSGFTKPAEVDIEVFYVVVPRPWINIQPDVQYIINPGGNGTPNALVLLLNVALSL